MTDKQIQASRENGAKSNGPATPEGKQKSSQNALKHGLCSRKHLLLPDESEEDYHAHNVHWMRQLQPQTGAERNRAEDIAYVAWQIERYQRIEVSMLSAEMKKLANHPDAAGSAFNKLANDTRGLDLLHRYIYRARRELKQAQEMYRDMVSQRERKHAGDKISMKNDAFERKWGLGRDEYSTTYMGKDLDILPNEPGEPGIYTAMLEERDLVSA